MAAEGYLQPFDSIGITPPRGRGGHSVPLPRPLTGACLKSFAPSGAASGIQLGQPPEGLQVRPDILNTLKQYECKGNIRFVSERPFY